MDANKAIKLRQIGYKVQKSCGICAHSIFPNDSWGTCSIHTYSHEKHSDKERQLSIHRSGICPQFEPNEKSFQSMIHFDEFIEK